MARTGRGIFEKQNGKQRQKGEATMNMQHEEFASNETLSNEDCSRAFEEFDHMYVRAWQFLAQPEVRDRLLRELLRDQASDGNVDFDINRADGLYLKGRYIDTRLEVTTSIRLGDVEHSFSCKSRLVGRQTKQRGGPELVVDRVVTRCCGTVLVRVEITPCPAAEIIRPGYCWRSVPHVLAAFRYYVSQADRIALAARGIHVFYLNEAFPEQPDIPF